MKQSILSTIGSTPLVQLRNAIPTSHFKLFGKCEFLNPGGSNKDRSALNIIRRARESGAIDHNTTVIESSSGNFGIGLAYVCKFFGLRFICVVDSRTNLRTIQIIKSFGAEIELITEPDPVNGKLLYARINRVQELLKKIPNSFNPNQYSNLHNAEAHYFTMEEIARDLSGDVDYLFVATSTCGTLRGCADYIRSHNLPTKIVAVDALGSVIFSSNPVECKRLIPGHGAGRRPELFRDDLADQCIHVTDWECVVGCHRLLNKEAIFAGGSSGGVLSAISRLQEEILPGTNCVMILCDLGERYLDTIYSDTWVKENFGKRLQEITTD